MAGTLSPIIVSAGLRQIVKWVHDGDITLCSESVTRAIGCGSPERPDLLWSPSGKSICNSDICCHSNSAWVLVRDFILSSNNCRICKPHTLSSANSQNHTSYLFTKLGSLSYLENSSHSCYHSSLVTSSIKTRWMNERPECIC
jgi:hypothetical protein